jgi:2',3'-cyclic-nucleotide 2'-phosphodiesterase (5'-nucleotidase family)
MYVRRSALALALFVAAIFSISAQEKTQCNVKVTLLQVNDVYQFAPVDQGTRGGLGRLLTLRKSIQQENPNTLFLMGGDTISPSVESISPVIIPPERAPIDADAVRKAFGARPIAPKVEGRIKWLGAAQRSTANCN